MKGQDIVDRAAIVVKDIDTTRWTDSEWLLWINDGQKQIALHRPDSNPKNTTVALVVGTKQTIPADGSRLLRVVRNMDGAKRSIRRIQREALDNELPEWHSSQDDGAILHFAFDNIDPKTYYVYPGVKTARQIEIIYLGIPADAASLNAALELDDEYRPPLLDYCLYRAYSKDAEYAGNAQRAMQYFQAFGADLGVKLQIDFRAALPANMPVGDLSGATQRSLT